MRDFQKQPTGFRKHFPFFYRVFATLFSPRGLKLFGVAVFGLVTLVALFYAIENWRGAREWKRVRADLVARGEPLTFAELVPPMPPDDENFAMSPYFKGVLDKSIDPASGKPRWEVWQKRRAAQHQSLLEGLGLDMDGNWRLGERARVTWRNRGIKLPDEQLSALNNTNEPFGVMRQFLAEASSDLAEIDTALKRPHSQFPVHYEDNVSALLPHLSEIKRLGWLFKLRALARLEAGDAALALEDIMASLQLADTIKIEPILISQLVREAILNLTLQPIWEGLAARVWTGEQLEQLQARLAAIDVLTGYQQGMRGERIFGTDLAEIVERKRNFATIGSGENSSPSLQFRDELINYAPKGWYVHNKAFIARWHTDYSVPAADPVGRRVYLDRAREYGATCEAAIADDGKLFIAALVMPDTEKAAVRFANDQASLDQAVVACALERHRLATGGYPDALAALVPAYLASLPNDVIDGEPLRYRKEVDSFVLYSTGANQIDDGGVAGFHEDSRGKHWRRDEGDWVWTYPDAAKR